MDAPRSPNPKKKTFKNFETSVARSPGGANTADKASFEVWQSQHQKDTEVHKKNNLTGN